MSEKKFTRRLEDFTCARCGARVLGNGYTNHCPECLWSRHVDVNPGDRAHPCKGMMEPIGLEMHSGTERIVHRCLACGAVARVDASSSDARGALAELSEGSVTPPPSGRPVSPR